jgi:hypothetical protein
VRSPIPDVPVKYLLECSERILGEYQLSRMNRAANLKREAREQLEEAIDNMVAAAFAMWLREHRQELLNAASSVIITDGP